MATNTWALVRLALRTKIIDNIHRTTELGTDRFHQFHLETIAYRRIGHDRQIDIAAEMFLPFSICLRTEQYRQPDVGIV